MNGLCLKNLCRLAIFTFSFLLAHLISAQGIALVLQRAGAACAAGAAVVSESGIELKKGPGRDKVIANCVMCHSLDYIQMNSPFLDQKSWDGIVHKMIDKMGAPIKKDDVPIIIEYLTKNYGR